MRRALTPHPASICQAVTRIEVDIVREGAATLVLHYIVTGQIADLLLPPLATPARTDELWRHTCFEVFVRASPGTAYYEFNFAPSTKWAAYRFDAYRSGMRAAADISAPRVEVNTTPECYALRASLDLARFPRDGRWRLGLSAVIEETSGRKSYWALAHPPGKADFHHADCFTHELSPA
jgi:hypothetical protein